jgi:hypothetical protein
MANNPGGHITNLDLEMAGLVLLWLTMEEVCGPLEEKRLTLFNDNSLMIRWATKLASKCSTVAEHLVQASPTCKVTKRMPVYANSHRREAHGYSRHPLAFIWQQPCVVLQFRQ